MKPAVLFTALCLSATAAAAQDQIERERQIFRALDMDGDARISREEARWGREVIEGLAQDSAGAGGTASPRAAPALDLFRRLDRDRDGQLSDSELWSAQASRGGGWIALDRDGNGRIAPSEFGSVRGN
jgi:EF hand